MEREERARQVWGTYRVLLTTVVRSILGDRGRDEDVEECVQDVVWTYLKDPGKWDPARGSEKTYLCVLARSRARNLRKKLGASAECPLDEGICLAAEDGMERAAVRDALERALAALDGEERRLFTLRFLYEWSTAEIAATLGISPSAVTTRTARLRDKLKKRLAREGIGLVGKE